MELMPADGMMAATATGDFGTSRLATLLSGYLSIAAMRKGENVADWPIVLKKSAVVTAEVR